MKIIKAKTAGFCFGVDRAVKLTYGLLEQGVRVATLGPLIHNPQCVADLAARGAVTVDTPEQVPDGYEVVVRSHGVPQCVYDALGARVHSSQPSGKGAFLFSFPENGIPYTRAVLHT